jgi:SAM-dependent methyltransferase
MLLSWLKGLGMAKTSASEFYNVRGAQVLSKQSRKYGSAVYSNYIKPPYCFAEKLLKSFIKSNSHFKVLDFCCGTGEHSVFLAKQHVEVTGLDISPDSIAAAKQLAEQYHVDARIKLAVSDLSETIPMFDSSVDVLFDSGSLYYFELKQALPEIKRVLKAKGLFCAVETNGDNFLLNTWRRLKNRSAKHRDERTLTRLLRRKDLKLIQHFFPGLKIRYFGCTILLGACLKRIPPLLKLWCFFARGVDWVLLDVLRLRFLAFKFVLYGYNNKSEK